MVGSQGKVEGESEGVTLDIPDRLNMGVLSSAYWQNEGGNSANQARWGVPGSGGELSIFYGGRASEYAGFLSELGMSNGSGAAQTGAAKLAMLFPVGDLRVGPVLYTGGQGAAYSFEYLNTGAADTHKLMGNAGPNKQHVAATYAGSWLGTRVDATGVSVVANNSLGFINVGKYAAAGPGTGNANDLPLTYARIATTLDVAGWDVGFGVQHLSGNMTPVLAGGVSTADYNANVIDVQAQGELGGLSTGLYVTYGLAPASSAGNKLAGGWSSIVKQNNGTQTNVAASSLNVAGTVEVMHGATVQAGVRFATFTPTVGNSTTDNAYMIGATYDISQNIALGLNYTVQSGTAWDALAAPVGKDATTFLLEALF